MIKISNKLDSLMKELKKTNPETFYHLLRTKKLTMDMLEKTNEMKLTSYNTDECCAICKGALLHDIGKLYIDNYILTKESFLTDEEKEKIHEHALIGFKTVEKELEQEEFEIVSGICRDHHERNDGKGYQGKTDLPMYVQIVSICDSFDSLCSDRVYREKFSVEKGLKLIEEGYCGFFDKELIGVLKEISEKLI